jgi:signal transduction histidine kinase
MRELHYTRRELLHAALLFLAYFFTAELGTYLHAAGTSPALIWPAAGIALGGLILGGYKLWPAIALASFLQQFLGGSPPVYCLIIAGANSVQALIATYFLARFKFNSRMERLSDTFTLFIVAILATMIVPTIGDITQFFLGNLQMSALSGSWGPWWTGEILSIIVITPFVLRWITLPSDMWTREEITETGIAFVALGAIDLFLFWTPYTTISKVSLVYVLLLPLFWIGIRMGMRVTSLALLLNAALILVGSGFGYQAAHSLAADTGSRLLQAEILIIILSVIFLILSSIAEERKNAANALHDHVRRLEKAIERISNEDDAKSEFIATLAHELRNPLAPLVSSLEIMGLTNLPENDRKELVKDMLSSIATMRHLLNDLLDISRISRRKMTLDKELVNVIEVAQQSIKTIQSYLQERNHTLTTSFPNDATIIEADRVRLEQILVNLLNNAIKYTDSGGTIHLKIETKPGMLTLSVKDDGIGIEKEMLQNIFDPFMQIHQGERKVAGLGIGLSLTSSLVEMHGGTIQAKSAGTGQGSEFIVRLPYIDADDLESLTAKPKYLPTFLMPSNLKILVVDDNQTAAKALQRLLTLRGYNVSTAFDGEEAIKAVPEFEPDVVMLDIGLPDMSGYEVAQKLREVVRYQGTLIALTGYGQNTDRRTAESAGFNYHLTKPAGLAEIEEILAKVI